MVSGFPDSGFLLMGPSLNLNLLNLFNVLDLLNLLDLFNVLDLLSLLDLLYIATLAQVTCSMLHCAPCSTSAMQASLFFVACALAGCLRSASWDVADAGGGYGRVQVRCVGG